MTTYTTQSHTPSTNTPSQRWHFIQTLKQTPLAHTLLTQWGRHAWNLVETQLAKHPFLQERPTFPNNYTYAIWYHTLTLAQQHGALPTRSLHQLTHTLQLPHETIRSWLLGYKKTRLLTNIDKLDHAHQHLIESYPPEALRHRLDPSKIYSLFKPLYDASKHISNRPQFIATAIQKLHATNTHKSPVVFAELRPYHKNGPKWLFAIAQEIHHYMPSIQRHLSVLTNGKMLQIGIENSILYIWEKDLNPDNWLNILASELFYLHSAKEKRDIVETVRHHLLITKQGLSRLIDQLTNHSGGSYSLASRIQALYYYHSYLLGATLHFLLNATGQNLIDANINRIGRGSQGYGYIHNPKFPEGEELHEFRARALAIMLSDGSLEPSGILRYSDDSTSRIDYVKNLFCSALGNIDTTVYTHEEKASVLRFPAIVGRIMQRWGMPEGDKFVQSFVLPDTVLNGSVHVKCAYLEEVIPEDGCFGVYGSKTLFRIGRSLVLDAGNKAIPYNFQSKISEQLKKVFTRLATKNPSEKESNSIAHYELRLTWGKLKEAPKSIKQTLLLGKIKKLIKLILDNPPELLLGEKRLLASLGIKTRMVPIWITQYSSGRLSVSWELMTSGRNEAKKWALMAPPSSGYKQRDVADWLTWYATNTDEVPVD